VFGASNELTGIITKPDTKSHLNIAVCLLNSGFIHRVGFNRFNTDFARKIVNYGLTSLRFDLHGLGDSARYDGKRGYNEQVTIDIRDAVSVVLEKSGAKQCILVGLCSGADYAHVAAVLDSRICGVVFLDGYAYHTLRFLYNDYKPALVKPWKILKFIINLLTKLKKSRTMSVLLDTEKLGNTNYIREFPSKATVMKEIKYLVNRGVQLYYVYSGGIPIYYNYENQFRDMFRSVDFKEMVEYNYISEADHTYTLISVRKKLMDMVITWIVQRYKLNIQS
jgi:hypothetical protein